MRTVPGRTESVIIIGAGLGGLSAALRLAGAGRKVTVIERESVPGGRAGRLELGGYSFDTGPTVLTMPELIEDAFNCVGESMSDRLELIRVDPAYRARFADGTTLDVHADFDAMTAEIADKCGPADVDGYRRFVEYLRKLYELERPDFIDRNLDSVTELIGPSAVKLLAMGGLRKLAPVVNKFLVDDRLRRIFSFQAMYAGLAPQEALAIYAVISYMDCVRGVYFPRGGMHALPMAMAAAATAAGVTFRYDTSAAHIEVHAGRAGAVILESGERLACDVVVANVDLPMVYRDLLDPAYTPAAVKKLNYSPSCVLMHVGSSASYDHLLHHTIEFGQAWDSTFDEIIHQGKTMSDPSFLISNPSLTDPSLAPAGKHSYYALFPCPNTVAGKNIDWRTRQHSYRDHMVSRMEERGMTGFGDSIEVEQLVTPDDWRAMGLAAGAPFSASHTLLQTGPLRRPTLDPGIENLVFCGANTQPGVGVPMVLLSGRLAAERITGRAS